MRPPHMRLQQSQPQDLRALRGILRRREARHTLVAQVLPIEERQLAELEAMELQAITSARREIRMAL